jgi:hypothetical protein
MTKIAPQLLGIAALAALLVISIRNDPGPEALASPFQAAVSRLRIGMTAEQARSALMIPAGLKPALAGSSHSLTAFYHDRQRRETLTLSYQDIEPAETLVLPRDEKRLGILRRLDLRLVRWELRRPDE